MGHQRVMLTWHNVVMEKVANVSCNAASTKKILLCDNFKLNINKTLKL